MPITLLEEGIQAFRDGDKTRAHQLLRATTEQEPENENAWLWLAGAAESDQERIDCLVGVLKLDPSNTSAAKGIAAMVAQDRVVLVAGDQDLAIPADASTDTADTGQSDDGKPLDRDIEETVFAVKPSWIPVILYGVVIIVVLIAVPLMLQIMDFWPSFTDMLTILVGPLIVITLLGISFGLVDRYFTSYTLTTQRLVVKRGILGRSNKTIPLKKIQDVSYRQSVIERLFVIGDVMVESAGEKGAIRLLDLAGCKHRTEQILKLVEKQL